MSIEKRLSPFLRAAKSLSKRHPGEQRHIQGLQTLSMARDRPTHYGNQPVGAVSNRAYGRKHRDQSPSSYRHSGLTNLLQHPDADNEHGEG